MQFFEKIGIRRRRNFSCRPTGFFDADGKERLSDVWAKSPLIPETTNRKTIVLIVEVQVRNLVIVAQGHVVGVIARVLRSTPEVSVDAITAEAAIVVPAASGQRGKTEGIRAVAIALPTRLGLENLARS